MQPMCVRRTRCASNLSQIVIACSGHPGGTPIDGSTRMLGQLGYHFGHFSDTKRGGYRGSVSGLEILCH